MVQHEDGAHMGQHYRPSASPPARAIQMRVHRVKGHAWGTPCLSMPWQPNLCMIDAMDRTFLLIGAVFGFLGVAFGAFGAHALKSRLSPEMLAVFETGGQ